MKFFNHPEGYVEPDGSGGFDYVYQYKDIWDNTRISYADANNDGIVNASEIRREQNYYPFGLEHKGYNGSISGVKNNLKTYQGQEFTEDLGLNTHEWKYRVSDPAIGRFWQVDPLAEDYVYNSTYAFQENKMGMGVELEGLELGTFSYFNPVTTWNAAKGAARAVKDFAVGAVETLATYNPRDPNAGMNIARAAINIASDPSGAIDGAVSNIKETVNTELAKGTEGKVYLAASVLLTVLEPSPAGEINAAGKGMKAIINGGKASEILKGVNSNLPHAVERAVERGVFKNADEASAALKNLTGEVGTNNLPNGTIVDPSKANRILVPVGNEGMAVYQVGSNGTAKLKTVLNEIKE